MENSHSDLLPKQTFSHKRLQDKSHSMSSKQMQRILTTLTKVSTVKKQTNRLVGFKPSKTDDGSYKPIRTAKLKRLLTEFYFSKHRERTELVALPQNRFKEVRPRRDLTEKFSTNRKVSLGQIKHPKPSKISGFGYVVGQRKDILDKSKSPRSRVIRVRIPQTREACSSTNMLSLNSPIPPIRFKSFDDDSRMSSDSRDRTQFGIMDYMLSLHKDKPQRRVIFQNAALKGWDTDISLNYSFC